MIPFSAGVVSLFDMQQFFADVLNYQISALYFGEAKLGFEKDENRVLPAAGAMVYAKLNIVQALFDSYGMTSSASQYGCIGIRTASAGGVGWSLGC